MGVCSAYKVATESLVWEGAPLGSSSLLSCAVVMGELSSQPHAALRCGAGLKPDLRGVSIQRHKMISGTAAMILPGRCALPGTLVVEGMQDRSTKLHICLVPACTFPGLCMPCIPTSCQGRLMWRPRLQFGPFPF